MSKPPRDRALSTTSTYFVTTGSWQGTPFFQSERVAGLLLTTLFGYRDASKFELHEFVVMPNHLHLLLSPGDELTLERAMQLIKGGFSHRVGKDLGSRREIWQRAYVDHRIRDAADYAQHRAYIHQNPVRAHLASAASEYPYSSAHAGFQLDAAPQWLKPLAP